MGGGSWNPFKGKKRTRTSYYTDVISVKVFEDDLLEQTKIRMVLEKLKKGYDAKTYILNYGNAGAAQLFQLYLNGMRDFIDFLPESGVAATTVPTSAIQTVLNSRVGETVSINFSQFAIPSDEDWIRYQLQEVYNYNVGIDYVVIDNIEYTFDTYDYVSNTFKVTLTRLSGIDDPLIVTVPANEEDALKYLVSYTIPSQQRTRYWIYDPATNVYPSLSNIVDASFTFDAYPIITLRNGIFSVNEYDINSKVVTAGNESETVYRPSTITQKRYESTKDMLNTLDIDIDELIDSIEENPDIDKLQDAFIGIFITPSDTDPVVSEALYLMFNYMYTNIPPVNTLTSRADGLAGQVYNDSNIYRASYLEEPYNLHLSWIPDEPVTKNEVIGNIGTYKHSISEEFYFLEEWDTLGFYWDGARYALGKITGRYHNPDGNTTEYTYEWVNTYTDSNGRVWGDEVAVRDPRYGWPNFDALFYYRPEIFIEGNTARRRFYTIKAHYALTMKYQITSTHTRTLIAVNLVAEQTIARGSYTGWVSQNVDDSDLAIPLPVWVAESMSYMNQVALLAHCMQLVFYAAEKHTITYYTSGWFGTFLQILAIVVLLVITIVSLGSQSGWTMPSMAAVISAIGTSIATGVALTIVLKIIASTVSNTYLKMALSLAAMVVAMYVGGGFDNFEFNFADIVKLTNMGVESVNIYVGDTIATAQADIQGKLLAIQNQTTTLNESYSSISEEYSKILQSFNTSLDPTFMVSLSTDIEAFGGNAHKVFSPSFARTMMIDGYRSFDTLYQNPVEVFFNNVHTIGIIE